ncbi:DUF2971 domain-containing protein [Aeromonas media]|uniref:DUF2971 domain-containing protein n=1 Tax=Aeromonas rivipollensis TaxID=948519 RepID=UPI0038D0C406
MDTLYKYYSSRLDLENYLLNPTIKLAQKTCLNDPFEGKFTQQAINIISKKSDTELNTGIHINEIEFIVQRTIEEMSRSLGVVSLSETQRNLLMWAHYASEHKGVCIGYKKDMFEKLPNKLEQNVPCYSYKPSKVNYDTVIFDEEQVSLLNKLETFKQQDAVNLLSKAIRTKSDDWMYEKEHRLIVPVEWSDYIEIHNVKRIPGYVYEVIDKMQRSRSYSVSTDRDKITIKRVENTQMELFDAIIGQSFENKLASYKETLFLKEVATDNIQSIHLGAHYPASKENALISLIENNEDLHHITLYKYELSNERFELTANIRPLKSSDSR